LQLAVEQRLVFGISNQSSENETKQTQQVENFAPWHSGSVKLVVVVVVKRAIFSHYRVFEKPTINKQQP
jgi:hypothetical protein